MSRSIDEILKSRKVVITSGTGGVGKTTLSATLALRAAMLGRKAVVITIDPAKRLAQSLGATELGDQPRDLTSLLRDAARKSGLKEPAGTLHAIMPDTRRTFEHFVRSLAPREEVAELLTRNPIFEIFARDFSGANEYMALQRLNVLHREGGFDLIVLDTPPSRNTLAFLNAPKLLAQFFDDRIIRWFVLPANKVVSFGMRKTLGILESLTGSGFMTRLMEFASGLFELRKGFVESLESITRLLESREAGFLLVAAPSPDTEEEIAHFVSKVRDHGFHFDGLIVNRTLGALPRTSLPPADETEAAAISLIEALQRREEQAIRELAPGGEGEIPFAIRLPELARDVHSVEDLLHVAQAFGDLRAPAGSG